LHAVHPDQQYEKTIVTMTLLSYIHNTDMASQKSSRYSHRIASACQQAFRDSINVPSAPLVFVTPPSPG
jgi:hypothetical protein